jgi:hypothetical protein
MRTPRSHGRPGAVFPIRFFLQKPGKPLFAATSLLHLRRQKLSLFGLTHYINFSSGDNFPYSLE